MTLFPFVETVRVSKWRFLFSKLENEPGEFSSRRTEIPVLNTEENSQNIIKIL